MEHIKILCIDDEPEILEMCQALLTSEGYDVRCAVNGDQAIKAFRKDHADIVVTDVRMPGMDGLEVLQAIKKIDALTEVIVLTGHGTVDIAVSALRNHGAYDFLTKPLDDLEDLLLTIEKALAHRRLRLKNATLMEELSGNQIHLANHNKELRRAKEALELSRQRYLDLYDRAPVGYVALCTNGTIIKANQTFARLFNLAPNTLNHKSFADFVMPGQMARYETFFTNMDHTSPSVCELCLTKADGVSFFALIEGLAILDARGHITQFRMTVSDISSQKETELALQESEQRYRALVETIPHGIQEIDTDGTITFANTSHAALHGYSINELVGKSVAELSKSKAEGRLLLKYLKNLSKTQPPPKTWWGQDRTKDGQIKDIQVDWDYKRDAEGEVVGFVSVLSDFTERNKAEMALKESEVRYRSFVENFDGIAFRLNTNGAPVFYHGAVKTISGYGEDELLACNPSWEELIHHEELSLVRMRRKRICLPGDHSITQEYRIRHRDGRWRWVREHTQSICTANDQPTVIQGVLFDITDYKHLQNKYFESKKSEAISTLAGGIAHQFNNALAGLMGNLELLEMEMGGHSSPKGTHSYTQSMMTMIQKMSQLTGQLLAYARGGKYLPTEVHMNDLVRQSVDLLRHKMSPEIDVEIELTTKDDWISVDTAQLQMVILAIMDNAMEAESQKGSILIQTHPFNPTPDFLKRNPEQNPGDYICLTIKDDGCGMDAQTCKKIFEPFFTTKFLGRGLGLSAAYGIITNHNGWMDVTSAPGEGTAVRIYLPTVSPRKRQPEAKQFQLPLRGDATILVVEDDAMVMRAVHKLLKKLHYRVLEAATGNKALDMLRAYNSQIDAVLLDIHLPDMAADELYAQMLKNKSDIRVVACSGYDKDGPAEALLDAGVLGFLRKPFSINTLAAKLRKVINSTGNTQSAIDICSQKHTDHKKQSHLKLI